MKPDQETEMMAVLDEAMKRHGWSPVGGILTLRALAMSGDVRVALAAATAYRMVLRVALLEAARAGRLCAYTPA